MKIRFLDFFSYYIESSVQVFPVNFAKLSRTPADCWIWNIFSKYLFYRTKPQSSSGKKFFGECLMYLAVGSVTDGYLFVGKREEGNSSFVT